MAAGGEQPVPGATETPPGGHFADLVSTLQAAADDRVVGHRLGMGQTTVHLRIDDADDQALTILLDREPIEVLEGAVGEAEVEISIPAEQLEHLWDEDYHLAMAIAKGHVSYSGPVRKFLRVMPILQRFSRRLHGREEPEDVAGDEDYDEEWR